MIGMRLGGSDPIPSHVDALCVCYGRIIWARELRISSQNMSPQKALNQTQKEPTWKVNLIRLHPNPPSQSAPLWPHHQITCFSCHRANLMRLFKQYLTSKRTELRQCNLIHEWWSGVCYRRTRVYVPGPCLLLTLSQAMYWCCAGARMWDWWGNE